MNPTRRSVLKSTSTLGLLVACGMLTARQALATSLRPKIWHARENETISAASERINATIYAL